jgi:hypothetical protein
VTEANRTEETVTPTSIRLAVEWLARNANGVSLIEWEPRSQTLLSAADEIEKLRRIAQAARDFVDNFPSTYVDDGNCRKEWRELNEALTDGDAT